MADMWQRHDVFISYRRKVAADLAQLLTAALTSRGYRVFLDVREMPSGPFPESIEWAILNTTDFVPLLTPGSLDGFGDAANWYAREIRMAFSKRRNIVPLHAPGFEVPGGQVSEELRQLLLLEHVGYSHQYADAAVDALCRRLASKPFNVAAMQRRVQQLDQYGAWSLSRGVRQVTSLIDGEGHTVTVRRTVHRGGVTILVSVDGVEQFSEEFPVLGWGTLMRDFPIGRATCRVSIMCVRSVAILMVRVDDTFIVKHKLF